MKEWERVLLCNLVIKLRYIMKECYVFEEDGRFTGQVIDMTRKPKFREIPKIRRVTPISLVLRYNILLEAFTKTKRDW